MKLHQRYLIISLFSVLSLSSYSMKEESDSLALCPNIEEIIRDKVAEGRASVEHFVDSMRIKSSDKRMSFVYGLISSFQGDKYYDNSEWQKAESEYIQSLNYFEELKDSTKLPVIYNNLGLVYFYQAFYDKAIEAFQLSLEVELAMHNRFGAAQCYQNMGLILEAGGEYDRGIEMYNKALGVYNELGELYEIASIHNNLAACYAKSDRLIKAENRYLEALTIFRELNDSVMEAKVLYNLGVLLIRKDDFDKGGRYVERALVLFKDNNDKIGEVKAYTTLGNMYLAKKSYNQAIYLYQIAEEKALALNYRELLLSNLFSLYSAYKHARLWERALETYENYTALKDSLRSDNILYEQGMMDESLEQKLLSRDLALLKEKRQNNMLTAVFVLMIVLCIWSLSRVVSSKKKLNRLKHNFRLEKRLLLSRINPDYMLPILNSLKTTQGKVETQEITIDLISNIFQFSGSQFISLEQEIDFIRKFCSVYETIYKMEIELNIETNVTNQTDAVMVPSMVSLFYLDTVIKRENQLFKKRVTGNIAFTLYDNYLEITFVDNCGILSNEMREIIKSYYLTMLETLCERSYFNHFMRSLPKPGGAVLIRDYYHFEKVVGNLFKLRLPHLTK